MSRRAQEASQGQKRGQVEQHILNTPSSCSSPELGGRMQGRRAALREAEQVHPPRLPAVAGGQVGDQRREESHGGVEAAPAVGMSHLRGGRLFV